MEFDIFTIILMDLLSMAAGATTTSNGVVTTTTRRPFLTNEKALADISNQLYAADVNSAGRLIKINLQNRTIAGNKTDRAPQPLIQDVPRDLLARPTYATLLKLYDNYAAAVQTPEKITNEEIGEENAFLDAVLSTDVMKKAYQFLLKQGEFQGDSNQFKSFLKKTWFGMYGRATGNEGSSGFEHVFLGELKNGISGLHSWLRFYLEESNGSMNYLGYIKASNIGQNMLIEMPMDWRGVYKPISSITVGTSPELELALYTICFLARPNSYCPVQANGARYRIHSFTSFSKGQRFVGTTYPTF